MKRLIIIATFICLGLPLWSQQEQYDIGIYIEQIIEATIASSEGDANVETIVSDLEELYTKPINLNAATAKELDRLWILNDFQIQALLDHRKKMGKIATVNELNYVFGFTNETVELILPFVSIGTREYKSTGGLKKTFRYFNHETIARIAQQSNTTGNYVGNNQKYYLRYKGWSGRKLNIGFLAEKDAGEAFFNHPNNNGFDFYSAFCQYNGKKQLNTIILGDYRMKTGQGLLMWPGYSSGKSSQISSIQRRGQGLSGNSSADEYGFLRGAATKLSHKNTSLSIYASHKNVDAAFDSVLGGIQSIRTSGLHRTSSEIEHKNSTTETLYGATIKYSSQHYTVGLNGFALEYSNPILLPEKAYQYFNFNGTHYNGVSADYKLLLQQVQFYGEVAFANNAIANIHGVNLMPHPQFTTSLTYRNYQESYFSPYSNALSEGSSISSEEGFYLGLEWYTNWKIRVSAYTDIYKFPWATYSALAPSEGKEQLIEVIYSPSRVFNLSIRYKTEKKPKSVNNNDIAHIHLEDFNKQGLRLHLKYTLSHRLMMATRYEQSRVGYENSSFNHGYLLYQDFILKPTEKMQLNLRYAWFDAQEYDARIYAYEHNARFVYSMPAYYGKGTKTYLMLRYNFTERISAWARYAYTSTFDTNTSNKHEGVLQLLARF